jgi:ABC-type dipeptide/oligopeptide/nickel transport system permease component
VYLVTTYVLQRLALIVPSLLAVYTITFFLMHATPGSPWNDDGGRPLPAHVIERLNQRYGLNRPVYVQYGTFLWGIVTRGDLGESYTRIGQSVRTIIRNFFPVSLQLGIVAMLIAVSAGVTLGIVGAVWHNTWIDRLATFTAIVGISTPNYVVATVLVILFAVTLGWLPTGGWEGPLSRRIIIPALALALGPMALIARYTRTSMLETLRLDYVRTARSKGLPGRLVLVRHCLPNALMPVLTVGGVAFTEVVTGSFFVETITGVPGIGRYFVTSVGARDYPVIIGTTLLFATVVMTMNLIVDLLYFLVNPKLRYG